MDSAVQAVNEKAERVLGLWKAKQLQQVLSEGYAEDATIVDGNTTFKGHAELFKLFQQFIDGDIDYTSVDTNAISDDTVIETAKYVIEGKCETVKVTWKKVGGDWKISHEQWN